MKRVLGAAIAAGLLATGAGGVTGSAQAQNASQCLPVAPPGMPNGGVLAVAAGQTAGTGAAITCTVRVTEARSLYWGARTANAWEIKGTRVSAGKTVVRTIASGKSVVDNDGMPAGGSFQAFANETISVTIFGLCQAGVCGAEGIAGVGG